MRGSTAVELATPRALVLRAPAAASSHGHPRDRPCSVRRVDGRKMACRPRGFAGHVCQASLLQAAIIDGNLAFIGVA